MNASIYPSGNNTRNSPRHSDTNVVCLASPSSLTPHVQFSPMACIDYQGLIWQQPFMCVAISISLFLFQHHHMSM